jgi:hypothetical protein
VHTADFISVTHTFAWEIKISRANQSLYVISVWNSTIGGNFVGIIGYSPGGT